MRPAPRLRRPRLAMLDLDGTLADTAPDLCHCVDRTLEALGRPPAGEAKVRRWIGNGSEALLRRALGGCGAEGGDGALLRRALDHFETLYARHPSARSRLFPGVRAGLDYLHAKGVVLACITNKAERHTRALLADLGLRHRFAMVVGGDTCARRKPDPEPLRYALARLGFPAGAALLIGDSTNDVRAARAAGVPVVCVSYGYNHGRNIRDAGPDAVIDSFDRLPALFGDTDRKGGRAWTSRAPYAR